MAEQGMLTDTVYPSLSGRVVFISGGASGIGESIVDHFCAQGARVAFVDLKADEGAALVARIDARGDPAPEFHHCDLRDIEKLQAIIRDVGDRLGNIAALVNNAAHDERHKIEDVTPEYWDDRLAVNMRHVFFATQAAAPQMIAARHGSIINFGSMSWMAAQGGFPAYTASKAATHGMTRGFARDFGSYGIRANTVVPGWVMTERQKTLWYDAEGEAELQRRQCLSEHVMPHDLARMVLFLASDDSRMCTAQNFVVDAGWT